MTAQLTAITQLSDLQQLRDLYLRDWPSNCVGYYCLDNFIRWLERARGMEIKNLHIFTLLDDDDNDNGEDGHLPADGLFLVVDRYQLFVNSLNADSKAIRKLTAAISQLDWTIGFKVSSFLERHRPAVLNVVRERQLTLEYDSLTVMYHMPREDALKLNVKCPAGYQLRPLSSSDADIVDALWPNRHQGSLFLIKRLIAWNTNMAVYSGDSDELVAWCLRLQGGFLGALQVKSTHKRLGLGALVASATAQRIAEMGHDVMALVHADNIPSRGMFDKLGFKVIDTCYWLKCMGLDWPEGQ